MLLEPAMSRRGAPSIRSSPFPEGVPDWEAVMGASRTSRPHLNDLLDAPVIRQAIAAAIVKVLTAEFSDARFDGLRIPESQALGIAGQILDRLDQSAIPD